ncbi:hypothetical protein JW865_07540 [Candidatus Bathyarchaeota archaeon]|nr:hypothetical protein [Candidatus Bathyarchaeota archaeon]
MTAGWSKAKDSKKLTWHYFMDENRPSLCGLAPAAECCQEKPDEYWACEVCKRKLKDLQ